jgi:TonB family protein
MKVLIKIVRARPMVLLSATCLLVILMSSACRGQDLRPMEQELRSMYQGHEITWEQPYRGEVVYDRNGKLIRDAVPVPACFSTQGKILIKSVSLSKNELRLVSERNAGSTLFHAGPSAVPKNKIERTTIHLQRGDRPWDRSDILAALQNIFGTNRLPPPTLPTDAQPPSAGADGRILFVLPDGPVYRTGNGVSQPHVVYQPNPEYTEEARKAGAGGTVNFVFVVNQDGSVSHYRPVGPPLGYGFDAEAAAVVQHWRFEPALLEGHPVKVQTAASVSFCLY